MVVGDRVVGYSKFVNSIPFILIYKPAVTNFITAKLFFYSLTIN